MRSWIIFLFFYKLVQILNWNFVIVSIYILLVKWHIISDINFFYYFFHLFPKLSHCICWESSNKSFNYFLRKGDFYFRIWILFYNFRNHNFLKDIFLFFLGGIIYLNNSHSICSYMVYIFQVIERNNKQSFRKIQFNTFKIIIFKFMILFFIQ